MCESTMEIDLKEQDSTDQANDNAEIARSMEVQVNNQLSTDQAEARTGPSKEMQINNQTDQAYGNAEPSPLLEIEINNQVKGTDPTGDNAGTNSTMEIEISFQDLDTEQAGNVKATPSLEINNQEKNIDPTDDHAKTRPTMEIQLNSQNTEQANYNVQSTPSLEIEIHNQETIPPMEIELNSQELNTEKVDYNAETTLELEISKQERDTDSTDINVQSKPTIGMQFSINMIDLNTDHADVNSETTPMDIQINNQDLKSDQAAHNTEITPVDTEHEYEYPLLFTRQTLLPLYFASWPSIYKSKQNDQNYLRGCKWSPDGTCCLSVVNNDGIHMSELPSDLLSGSVNPDGATEVLKSMVHVQESGLVYDFCWYPFMNSQIPASCGWITTKQRAPIQLWDAFDGSLRASYRGFNAVDEMEPAISITFSADGTRIIGGYKKVLRTFDIERPGRDFAEHKINSPASCFAVYGSLLAMGSWNTSISLFSMSQRGTYKSLGKMHGHSGGVTHMQFTPDGLKLVSGARKDHRLLIWDIRYYRRPLNILTRAVNTNQRIYFDISPCGRYLVTGGTNGEVKVWDVEHVNWRDSLNTADIDSDGTTRTYPLHKDCCNSVSIHPYLPILATGSGQHHLNDLKLIDDDSNENTIMDEDSKVNENVSEAIDMKYSTEAENKLTIWWTTDILNK